MEEELDLQVLRKALDESWARYQEIARHAEITMRDTQSLLRRVQGERSALEQLLGKIREHRGGGRSLRPGSGAMSGARD